MTAKELRETELRIQVCERPLVVPYSHRKYEGGEINGISYEYQSIVNNPDVIDTIPELFDEPEIKEFIRQVNGNNGIFETFRVVVWSRECEGAVEKTVSFGFGHRDRKLIGNYLNCFTFASDILGEATFGNGITFDRPSLLEISPLFLKDEGGIEGWIMDLYVSGYGKDLATATTRLSQILNSLLPFFKED